MSQGITFFRGALVRPGQFLPAVGLPSTAGRSVNLLSAAAQSHVVLFFYPGDGEGLRYPELRGCTAQACSIRDEIASFRRLGAQLFGVSLQAPERQQRFAVQESLEFELLSDQQHRLVGPLGIGRWVANDGQVFAARTTVVAARGGRITHAFPDVVVDGHIDEVLKAVAGLPVGG
jgi:peroxiredoxin Q/BCP